MVKFKEYVDPAEKVQGDHVIGFSKRVLKDFIDDNTRRNALFGNILDRLNLLYSDFPDYDTGYLLVEAGEEYTVEHKIGTIPLKFLCFFSASSEPKYAKKEIYVEPNLEYREMNDEEITVKAPTTFIDGSAVEGYIRILLWR